MLEERARVISVDTNSVWVEADRSQGCAKCEAGEGCGGGMLTKLVKRNASRIEVLTNVADLSLGEDVIIGLNEQALLRSSVMAYLVPVAGLFAGALFADVLLKANDLIVAGMGVLGLVVGFMLLKRFSVSTAKDQRYTPVVLRRASKVASGCQIYVADKQN